jgi:acetate kinase
MMPPGGFDVLVFTAGIGEHAPEIRHRVCEKAGWLGLEIDEAANAAGGPANYERRQRNNPPG